LAAPALPDASPPPHIPPAPDRLRAAIDHAARLLPAQGPITVFIHHNTLHAFEGLPFEEAVRRAGDAFGCQSYLTEERYRAALGRGRVRFADLRAVLEEDLGERACEALPQLGTRLDLRLAMLQYPLAAGTANELKWFIAETDALRRVRPEASAVARGRLIAETRRWVMRDLRGRGGAGRLAPPWLPELFARFGESGIESWGEATWEAFTLEVLWRVCREGVRDVPPAPPPARPHRRHRDLLLQVTGVDTDSWVHGLLTRFSAAYLDQGLSHWPLPGRETGFFAAFCSLYRRAGGPPDRWLGGLSAELARLQDSGAGPPESARESLAALGVEEAEWEAYLSATLLALRGWGGMIREVQARGDRVALPIQPESLIGFVAVRLLLERFALAYAARTHLGFTGPLAQLRNELLGRVAPAAPPEVEERTFAAFQLAQVLGGTPDQLARLAPADWSTVVREIEAFGESERRRVFHRAYERRFRDQVYDALSLHARQAPARDGAPRFQIVTCLDDREESFRRHLEEVAPDCETFGAAGFFAVAMYYKGAGDAHFTPLCPIAVAPKHWVEERAEGERGATLRRMRRVMGAVSHRAHVGTRSALSGALLAGTLGVLAPLPLVARVLLPRLTARARGLFRRVAERGARTRLKLERDAAPAGDHPAFTPDEMADAAERLLRDIGLTGGFARLVFAVGHGSGSLNNPHKSAYDCGACGGNAGAANGRAAAQILNDPRVRRALAGRGLVIPDATWFVGGLHNTCDDSVTLYDVDRVPDTHRAEFERARGEIDAACDRNAHERCRRFMSAPLTLSFAEARQHVAARSEDLAQTRPELGHATNAVCHVGRRERTRGLFLDRRVFLTSYDPTRDSATGGILARTMAAVFPVCGGINLEYYFSHVDPAGYGCGTKLPHNVTSLLGVVDGAGGDLRTGLPWQMTELHEPVRLIIVCETTPDVMRHVLANNPAGRALVENEWVRLATQLPDRDEILMYHKGEFITYQPRAARLPAAASSADWYRGWRDHLEFAEIDPGSAAVPAAALRVSRTARGG
jgi:uncharacterized protein YbcC (UPF0753/DUF2309 family)